MADSSQPARLVAKTANQKAPTSAAEKTSRNADSKQKQTRPARPTREASPRPGNPFLIPLQLVSGAYFPFLGCIVLVLAGSGLLLLSQWRGRFTIILGSFLILTALHIVIGLFALFQRVNTEDAFEIELPSKGQKGLEKLVERVATERDLDSPDIIRLHAQSMAHIYEDRDRNTVLVIGGTLIAMLPQQALAGVIAHELTHCTAGDIKRSRIASHWHRVMLNLENRFLVHRWAMWNPFVWLIRLYHHVYFRLFFASKRRAEFLADSYYVDQVGEEAAATTLVLLSVLDNMPWANLENMAESMSKANYRVDHFFEEQVRRLRSASTSDWENALRKALQEEPEWYLTHPVLKERLKPLGVKAKSVLPLAMNMTGEPSTALFANWSAVEQHLSKRLLSIARVLYGERRQAFDDIAAIMRTV